MHEGKQLSCRQYAPRLDAGVRGDIVQGRWGAATRCADDEGKVVLAAIARGPLVPRHSLAETVALEVRVGDEPSTVARRLSDGELVQCTAPYDTFGVKDSAPWVVRCGVEVVEMQAA